LINFWVAEQVLFSLLRCRRFRTLGITRCLSAVYCAFHTHAAAAVHIRCINAVTPCSVGVYQHGCWL